MKSSIKFSVAFFLTLVTASPGLIALSPTPAHAESIKLGLSAGLTGYIAGIDGTVRDGALLAVEKINRGGGINGRNLELIVEDNKSDPAADFTAVSKFIVKDKVSFVTHACLSAGTGAIGPLGPRHKIPIITTSIIPKSVEAQEDQYKWLFSMIIPLHYQMETTLKYFEKKGWKRVAIIHDTTPYNVGSSDLTKKKAEDYKIEVVASESREPSDFDPTPILIKFKALKPNVILNLGVGPVVPIIKAKMAELGMDIPLASDQGYQPPELYKQAGDVVNGILFPATRPVVFDALPKSHPQYSVIRDFVELWHGKYGKFQRDPHWAAHGYDMILVVAEAMRKTGSTDGTVLRDVIEKMEFTGIIAPYKFTPKDHWAVKSNAFVMGRVVGPRVEIAE